jgi:hypothetical protein
MDEQQPQQQQQHMGVCDQHFSHQRALISTAVLHHVYMEPASR